VEDEVRAALASIEDVPPTHQGTRLAIDTLTWWLEVNSAELQSVLNERMAMEYNLRMLQKTLAELPGTSDEEEGDDAEGGSKGGESMFNQ
jgi:hypothetical protein